MIVAALGATSPVRGDESAGQRRVQHLLELGAQDLAARLLDELQPAVAEHTSWYDWERLRYRLHRQRGDWPGLSRRVAELSAELPLFSRQQLTTYAVGLMLDSNRGDLIRRHVRELLWYGAGDSQQVSYWRRLIVRAYLAEDSIVDARIAIERYRGEYLPADSEWSYLYAEVLLRAGDAPAAAAALASAPTPKARILRALSRLQAAIDEPQQTLAAVRELAGEIAVDDPLQRQLLVLEARAARDAGDLLTRVSALERLFQFSGPPPAGGLWAMAIDDLWSAYHQLALAQGNERNLLLGEPQPWLDLAAELEADGRRVASRSIHALLGAEASVGHGASASLYDALDSAGLGRCALALFTASRRYAGEPERLPAAIRHRIARYAMDRRDLDLAARMVRDLDVAAPGQDPLGWTLIRARLAIYTGAPERGERLLHKAITPLAQIDVATADRIMQLLFDLQSVERHAAAVELFAKMRARAPAADYRREIDFWMAQSKAALGEHQGAALLYIASAMAAADGADLWGQTSRLRAAESLAEAGLIDDAQRIYEGLLAVTADHKQRMSLERRLQQLWLRRGIPDGGPSTP